MTIEKKAADKMPNSDGPERASNGSAIRFVVGLLTGAVLSMSGTGIMSYAAFWRNSVTVEQAERIVATQSPYNTDRGMILAALSRLEAQQDEMNRMLRVLSKPDSTWHGGVP